MILDDTSRFEVVRQTQDSPGLLVGEDAHDGSGTLWLQHVVSAQCQHLWQDGLRSSPSAVRWCKSSWQPFETYIPYGIYANIGGILMVNVTIYSIHGSYGYGGFLKYPKWGYLNMVSNGKSNGQSYCNGWFGGIPALGNLHTENQVGVPFPQPDHEQQNWDGHETIPFWLVVPTPDKKVVAHWDWELG
jgi:hypothetical protein